MQFQDDDLKVLSVSTATVCLYLRLLSLSSLFPYLYLAICLYLLVSSLFAGIISICLYRLYLPVSSVSGYVPRSISEPLRVSLSQVIETLRESRRAS